MPFPPPDRGLPYTFSSSCQKWLLTDSFKEREVAADSKLPLSCHLRDKTNVGQKISALIATYCDALWAPKWGNKDKCRRYYHLLQGLRNETGLASRNQIKAKISFILSDENGNLFSSTDFGLMMRVIMMHQLMKMTIK